MHRSNWWRYFLEAKGFSQLVNHEEQSRCYSSSLHCSYLPDSYITNAFLSHQNRIFGRNGMSIQEKEKIRKTLQEFFLAQETGDDKRFLKVWHPDARRFGFGSNNELYILATDDILANQLHSIRQARKTNPDFSVTFLINRIKHIDVHKDKLIASAVVEWQMLSMGQAIGVHYTYFHLVKTNRNWVIVNITDRGKDL